MKNRYILNIILIVVINVWLGNKEVSANDRTSTLNVSPVSFTVPSAGWYKVGGWTTSAKRGAIRVAVSLSGGLNDPQTVVIDAFKNWNATLNLRVNGLNNSYIEEVRITEISGLYYVEVYIDRAITGGGYLYHYELEGYWAGFILNSGELPFGSGNVKKETHKMYNKMYTSSGLIVDGYVGIGTAIPDEKLTVKGTIHSEEIRVESVGADFVFASDYNLMPLAETEAYIKANHHLPEVPSAAEMQESGLELGKMNILLLQKIEEMTLHQIEMNKLLLEQQKQLEVQNQKIANLENILK